MVCVVIGTRDGTIFNDAIRTGLRLPLVKSFDFPHHEYVRHVNVYE
ncbi:MAG: hypothetical protein US54_C0012G0038 [Candidatus Roizmanbacteria bacterium GW2011_GWA2_37_7]|uniref:Uncharacterized protein n=1 Tax=Candidatus Roizmanbacteria bacterium GW2011_GWA2_37_7 TaxID=1618481 RepID=A0A0G0KCM9_9BACT|nr:MAG: hypothetical protein US54_C0012G0038 [Candidatus Roizmanbacteria bacterium GW2011_GWA2_37_7]